MEDQAGPGGVTGQELERLRRVVARLTEAHQEALDVCDGALGPADVDLDDDVRLSEASERLRVALEEVRAILGDAAEDVRSVVGEGGFR